MVRACTVLTLSMMCATQALAAGRFVVLPPEVTSRSAREQARDLEHSGVLPALVEALNTLFVLPRNVGMKIVECEEANAYYDTEAKEISLCVELMEGMAETLAEQYEDEDELATALAGAYIAVALHEAGHALVDVLELPITGREEDAVDQLSAWMLIESDDVDSVLGAASSYYVDEGEIEEDEFADEHSLSSQRYYNLLCWAYGSDPDNSEALVEEWSLPEARAEQCGDEYALLDRSWSRLLKPHLRDDEVAPIIRAERTPKRPTVDDVAPKPAPPEFVGRYRRE
jgi:hypothetical protein